MPVFQWNSITMDSAISRTQYVSTSFWKLIPYEWYLSINELPTVVQRSNDFQAHIQPNGAQIQPNEEQIQPKWGTNIAQWGTNTTQWGTSTNQRGTHTVEWGQNKRWWGTNEENYEVLYRNTIICFKCMT